MPFQFGGQQTQQTEPGSSGFQFSQEPVQSSNTSTKPVANTPQPQLPEGAIGTDPSGNPFFGDNLSGLLKKWTYQFTKDVKPVDQTEWDSIKERWSSLMSKNTDPNLTQQEKGRQGLMQGLSLAGETISKGYQAAEAQGSKLSPILKGVSVGVTAIGDLFSIPAKKLEQAIGAKEGFQEAANTVTSPLPRLDENNFTKGLEEMPILGAAYDFARIALSPSDNKWEYTKQKIEEGWQSGRILYSQIFDATLKDKFLQDYREGQDPGLLELKLQNPLAELGGQLVLDPLNLVGAFAKGAKVAKELDLAHDSVVASGLLKTEAGVEAFKAVQAAEDETSAVAALTKLADAHMQAVNDVTSSSRLLNVGFGINDLTTSSRQNALISKGKELLGNMALVLKESGMSYDGVAEAVLYGAKSVSKNADEVKAGLAGLSHLPNANMWLSDDYIETFSIVHNLLKDEQGTLNGARLAGLMKVSDPAEFSEAAVKMLKAAAMSEFPDVNEMKKAAELVKQTAKGGEVSQKTIDTAKAYESLPNHVKIMNDINEAANKVRNPINKVLSYFYFNMQGGVAVRNVVSNNELILVDKGAGAWVKDGKYWSVEEVGNYLKDIYGELPESAHGFKSLVSSMTDSKPAMFGKIMEVGEEKAAVRVVGAAVRDVFKKMIPTALPDLSKEIETGVLTSQQADKLTSFVLKNNGNVERAIQEFRDFYKVGAVESWRNLDFVSDFEKNALEGLGYWGEIEHLASTGANDITDVESVINKMKASIDSRSELAVKDVVGLSADHPGAPAWGDLMKAVDDGLLNPGDHQVFTAIMESAEQSRLEYQTLLDNVALKAQNELFQAGRVEEAQHIGEEMNRVRQVLRESAPATAKETHGITQDAWRWSDAIKKEKKPDISVLQTYWKKAGLEGDAPLDLTKQSLLKELWKQRFEKVTKTWNASFDAIVGESETILKQMEGVVDTQELSSMAERTRHITEQAQAYRSATFESGALRITTNNDAYKLARDYGVASASDMGKPLNQHIVNSVNKYMDTKFKNVDEIPLDVMKQAFEKRATEKGLQVSNVAKDTAGVSQTTAISQAPKEVKPLPKLEDNYLKPLSTYANTLYHETNPDKALALIPNSNVTADVGTLYTSNVPDLALGQGNNKGVLLEFDPGKIEGQVNRSKPTWQFSYEQGQAEFISRHTKQPEYQNSLRSLTITDTAPKDVRQGNRLKLIQQKLEGLGWNKEVLENGSIKYTKPAGETSAVSDVAKAATESVKPEGITIPPPHPLGAQPSLPRAWNESAPGAKYTLDNILQGIKERWGQTDNVKVASKEMDAVLERVSKEVSPKINEIKATALKVADEQRKFTLLNYGEKTYGDVALSYLMPYHFFYTRSYKNWISRIATNPEIVAGYGKYKNALEQINKDLPDWYKQQVDVTKLLGIQTDHPLFFNLESTFNPLYGLTGTDFNDPAKRTNWATATLDDMGKFGPTLWAPIQMAVASKLFMDGETDAASRWGNRLIPETAQVKAVTSLFGKPVELDPAVQLFSGGIDPYERGRMGYAAAQLIQEGKYTPEQVQEQFQQQEGPAWDESYQLAVQSRAASSISSYFLGVGFKPRSTNDVMVEEMYTNLNQLYAMSDTMNAEDYKSAWEKLRSQYPDGFVDTVLLAKKGGDKRDAAYAYSVLGRLPPGEMGDVFKAIGISQKDISRFYDSKGFADKSASFTATEKTRFMSAITDLGAMLKIPDTATRTEWNEARSTYQEAYKEIQNQLGQDIWDKVTLYYDLKDDNPSQADTFKQEHPEVQQALQMKGAAVANSPILSAYYGGIDNIEAYLSGKVRQQLSEKYGADIYDKQQEYFNVTNQRAYLAQHPELKRFWSENAKLQKESDKLFLQFGAKLPDPKGAQFRNDFTPQSGVQETLYNSLQPQSQVPSWQEVSQGMPEWLQSDVMNYYQNGKKISTRAQKELDYLAKQGGYYDYKDLLRTAGLSLQKSQ